MIAYFRLICTDVKSTNYITKEWLQKKKGQDLHCEPCQIIRRRDIRHCSECKVCVEYYDHHCGVFQVCVAGKTFKFFLLVIVHAVT